jgi:hypothetical protein
VEGGVQQVGQLGPAATIEIIDDLEKVLYISADVQAVGHSARWLLEQHRHVILYSIDNILTYILMLVAPPS